MVTSRTWILSLLLAGLPFSGAFGAEGATTAVKYRQASMKALGGHAAALGALLKGEVSLKGHAAAHAAALGEGLVLIADLFPQGSDRGETDVLPVVWQKPAEFGRASESARAAGAKLQAAARAQDPEALKAAFAEAGKSCRGCHEGFRVKR